MSRSSPVHSASYIFVWHRHKYVLPVSVWWLAMCFPLEKRKARSQKNPRVCSRLHSPQILCSQFLRVRRIFSRLRAQRRVASATTVISSLSSTRLVYGRFPWPSKLWKVDRRPCCVLGHSAESNSDSVSTFYFNIFFLLRQPADCLISEFISKRVHFCFNLVCWAFPVSLTATDMTGDKKAVVGPAEGKFKH